MQVCHQPFVVAAALALALRKPRKCPKRNEKLERKCDNQNKDAREGRYKNAGETRLIIKHQNLAEVCVPQTRHRRGHVRIRGSWVCAWNEGGFVWERLLQPAKDTLPGSSGGKGGGNHAIRCRASPCRQHFRFGHNSAIVKGSQTGLVSALRQTSGLTPIGAVNTGACHCLFGRQRPKC